MVGLLLIAIPVNAIRLTPSASTVHGSPATAESLSPGRAELSAILQARQREEAVNTATATAVPAKSIRPAAGATPQGRDFQWVGNLAQGETLEVRGAGGQIRTIASTDGLIHVNARISDPARLRVDVLQRESGITICAVLSTPWGERSECQPRRREETGQRDDERIDFLVQVPAGVRFAGSMIQGDIELNQPQSDAIVATISGNIALILSRSHGAEFSANVINGAIDSDVPLHDSTPPLPSADRVAGPRAPRIVHATLGRGGPALRVTTIDGNIQLRHR